MSNQDQQNVFPVLALLGGASIWGLLWYPYRLLEQAEVSGPAATMLTYAFALLLGLMAFRKNIIKSRVLRGKPQLLLWIGLCAGWTNLAYVLGVIHGEIMRVMLLFYLAPLWTIVFSRLLLNEVLSLHGYLVIVFSLAGAVVMLWQPETGFSMPSSYGDWMGLSAGFMFALSNVLSRMDQVHTIQLKSLAVWAGVTLIAFGYSLFLQPLLLGSVPPAVYPLILGVGLVVFGLSMAVQYGLAHVPANRAIVIMLFELVIAALGAYFLAGEAMTTREWIGGSMIISATLFSSRMNRA